MPFHGGSKAGSQFSTLESFSEIELASRSEAEGVVRPERSGGDGRDGQSSSSSSSATTRSATTGNSVLDISIVTSFVLSLN